LGLSALVQVSVLPLLPPLPLPLPLPPPKQVQMQMQRTRTSLRRVVMCMRRK
jgi:hypothetical protein